MRAKVYSVPMTTATQSSPVSQFFTRLGDNIGRWPTKYIFLFFMALAAVIACVSWGQSQDMALHTRYNNFVIFKHSFFHLIHNQDLYTFYQPEYYDLYKYSPSFALCMGVFAWLPDLPALILFNVANAVVLIIAVRKLPFSQKNLNIFLLLILIETMISFTSSQVNALITGLLVLAWYFLENDKPWWATLFIVITFYIKIFGIVGLALCLLYPSRWKSALATICWIIVIGIMPLLVISPSQLLFLYKSWGTLLSHDHGASVGVSLYGWWHTWFGFDMNKQWFVLIGALLFCLPLLRVRSWAQPVYRLHMLASVLIWVVIFNHKGESPTYVIAMAGIGIWYYTQAPARSNLVLLLLALVFTSFSSTDLITPYKVARTWVEPYAVKAVFCSIIWFKLIWDLTFGKLESRKLMA